MKKKSDEMIKNAVQIVGLLFLVFGFINLLDDVLSVMPTIVKFLLLIFLAIMFMTGDMK